MIVEEKPMSYRKIRKIAGEGWALIVDPVYSEDSSTLMEGKLIYFSASKKDVHDFIMRDKKNLIRHYAILYTGTLPQDQIFVL